MLMDLQNEPNFKKKIKPIIEPLRTDPLLSSLSKKRDLIVHRGMLELKSSGAFGSTRGRGIKMGLGCDVAAAESSDEAFLRFANICAQKEELLNFFGLDDEDLSPCIERKWRLEEFGDKDLLELAIEAWQKVGEVISKLVIEFGGEPLDLRLSCAHAPEKTRIKIYSKDALAKAMKPEPQKS